MPTPDNQAAAKKFSELGLSKTILAALNAAGYERPTDIQAGVIPLALAGKDVIGQARTGTGKTASFILPILNGYDATVDHRLPQAIVLVPTRELAVQVRDEAVKLSHGQNARIEAVYGGKPLKAQIDKLKRGCDVLIGTPGRVLDHLGRGSLRLDRLKFVVLDEADRMLDIGFRPDIEKILRKCPQSRQTMLLSATVPPEIMKLAQRYMMEPVTLDFSPKDLSVETIEQHYFTVDQHKKFELLLRLLVRERPRQAIVFCRTKRRTDTIHERLSKKLPRVEAIHGDLSQGQRDRVMRGFRDSKIRFLVATDVVGRGIDVSTVSHIINYDVPMFCDDYVHRVGRTGRMGREGVAYTFVTPEEGGELTRIEHRINRLLKRDEMKNFEAVESKAGGVNAAAAMLANRVGAKVDGEMSMDAAPLPASPPPKKAQKRYKRGL